MLKNMREIKKKRNEKRGEFIPLKY